MLRLYLTLKLLVFNCSEVCRLIYFHTLGVGENLKKNLLYSDTDVDPQSALIL